MLTFQQANRKKLSGIQIALLMTIFCSLDLISTLSSKRFSLYFVRGIGHRNRNLDGTAIIQPSSNLIPDLDIISSGHMKQSNLSPSHSIMSYFKFSQPGDQIPDFSYAGYRSNNAPIPFLNKIVKTFSPTNDQADRTQEIQSAIDSLSGSAGVILFLPGEYILSSKNSIRMSSLLVLRGDSSVPSKTIFRVSGPPRNLFEIGDPKASGLVQPLVGSSPITQAYVGIGAKSVEVQDANQFKIGQSIVLQRLVTNSWVKRMNMDNLFRHRKPQVWIAIGTPVNQEREITAINGNQIMWEVPLTDSIDLSLAENTAKVFAYQPPVRVQQVGIENFSISQELSGSSLLVGTPTILPIRIGGAEDCWIKNIQSTGFLEFSYFMPSSRRITMSDFIVIRDKPTSHGGRGALPLDITLGGSQVLLLRGQTIGNQNTASYIVATAKLAAGPNVVSGYIATGSNRHMIEPHQRWSTGFLVENSHVGQINLKNRGIMGSGHGWAIATGVIWACSATKMTVEDPPMSRNFKVNSELVENFDDFRPDKNQNDPIKSLYQLQLNARIGIVP